MQELTSESSKRSSETGGRGGSCERKRAARRRWARERGRQNPQQARYGIGSRWENGFPVLVTSLIPIRSGSSDNIRRHSGWGIGVGDNVGESGLLLILARKPEIICGPAHAGDKRCGKHQRSPCTCVEGGRPGGAQQRAVCACGVVFCQKSTPHRG